MIAKFENGHFLEIEHDETDNEYVFAVYDEEGYQLDYGYTEYRSIDMYYPMNEIDYILEFCEPEYVEGKYEIVPFESVDEYIKFIGEGYICQNF